MYWYDWGITLAVLLFVVIMAITTKKYMQSIADFLVANRLARRYMLTIAEAECSLGAITIIAMFEMYFTAGFTAIWWGLMMIGPVGLLLSVTGWVYYRFRETRAMTLAQFFELRYSRRFRVFAGLVAWVSGILNFGIFPAVGARFFVYYCGFSQVLSVGCFEIPTFILVMVILLCTALFFVYQGGQVTVLVTDFIQGMFTNVATVIILVSLMVFVFDWGQIRDTLLMAPRRASLVNPLSTSKVESFTVWYFIIIVIQRFYTMMGWQGPQAYYASAKTAHEAKMGRILGVWRLTAITMMFVLLPICAYAVLHHPAYTSKAEAIESLLETVDNEQIQKQLTVTVTLPHILPKGLLGLFAAIMLVAFISTHDTYLHSWGSIFVQDVILPFRKTPLSKEQHIRLLRLSIAFVAIFIFFFSVLFRQNQHILMFFVLTASIWAGSGAVIIGGLYWRRGTCAGAWSGLIVGAVTGVSGVILDQVWPKMFDVKFPINGQWYWFITMILSVLAYVIVSLLGKKKSFNLDKMLHRGDYAIESDRTKRYTPPVRGIRALGINEEFSRGDKLIAYSTIGWTVFWFSVMVIGTVWGLLFGISDSVWAEFWHVYIWICFVLGIIVTAWFLIGGTRDMLDLYRTLRTVKRIDSETGRVEGGINVGEEIPS